jgi:hypothetical protein
MGEGWLDKPIFEKKKRPDYDDEKFTGVY